MRDRCVTAVGMHTGCNVDPKIGAIDLEVGLFRTGRGRIIKVLTGFSIVRELPLLWYVICGTKGCLETKGCGWDDHKAYFKPLSKGREMTRVSDEDVNNVAREVYTQRPIPSWKKILENFFRIANEYSRS